MIKDETHKGLTASSGGTAFLIGLLAMLFIEVLLALLIKDSNTLSLVFSYTSQFAFILIALVFAYRSALPSGQGQTLKTSFAYLGFRKPRLIPFIIAVFLPIASIVAFLPVSTLVEYLFSLIGYVNPPSYADYTSSVGALFLVGIGLCVFPAFGEEFLTRGSLMRGLREKGTAYAIFMSALAFGLMHGSPTQFIYQFIIGVIMAYMVYITDCVWYSVLFHGINNTTVVLYNYFYVTSGSNYQIPFYVYIIMFVVGLCLVAFLLWAFSFYLLPKESRVKSPKKLLIRSLQNSEVGIVSYSKSPCWTFYIALAVIAVLFIVNTVGGWSK